MNISKALALLTCIGLLGLTGCGQDRLQIDTQYQAMGQDSRVQFIVLHYTSGDFPTSLATLTKGQVSSHYLISDHPAKVYQLVDEQRRAWHAGDSFWQGRTWLNSSSIGIELVNLGYQMDGAGQRLWYPFPEEQIEHLIVLLKDIMARHRLKPGAIVAHSDIAPARKVDPGPLFPWKRLAEAGLIPWPAPAQVSEWQQRFSHQLPSVRWYQESLSRFGYKVPQHGILDKETRAVLAAFQMRYRPARFDGEPDAETGALLTVLNTMVAAP
ncbi:N-acetylmuramoyl-L-alanine amidase [Azomonas agilis]|uniref:N-acetylmuramoyl-L-alanine amidase n=2 Tax=Azomonas agilis TaxID=116849 RepID=A0A562IL51_9GAMM|nr:N-acetylmuramoyl-L-alanine amidase [Azomonas agilis]